MAEVEMDDQNRIKELQQHLEHAREHLRQEMEKLDKVSKELKDKYGIDYLHFIQGKPVQEQVKIVRVVNRIFNVDGELRSDIDRGIY